jgi:magnesium-transporting ATPase (P-type)
VLRRAFGVLGPTEALVSMVAFVVTLRLGGWSVGTDPGPQLLATASGTAFTAIVLGQLANAFACRSESRWIGATGFTGNRLLQLAVAAEAVILVVYLAFPPLSDLLGGSLPDATGWLLALLAIPAVWAVDAADKWLRRHSRTTPPSRWPGHPDS